MIKKLVKNIHISIVSFLLPFSFRRGAKFGGVFELKDSSNVSEIPNNAQTGTNALWEYFLANETGPGIWKWEHYFDVYHKHLGKFQNKKSSLLEIGIYSGGSLGMWQSYLGSGSNIIGVDLEKDCLKYESDSVSVRIGDQSDRAFWRQMKAEEKEVDIIIDDGGHTPNQQMVTIEELLPCLKPGGVYICEDIHGLNNRVTGFVAGMINNLNAMNRDGDPGIVPTTFQKAGFSIHHYPFILVIERSPIEFDRFRSTRMGTQWEPFFD